MALQSLALQACSSNEQLAGIGAGDAVDRARYADLGAHFPQQAFHPVAEGRGAPMLFPAEGDAARATMQALAAEEPAPPGEGVEINFEQADVQTVAKAILGDQLGMNFVVDARITAPITIVSTAPIARKNLLPALESALRLANAAIVRDHDVARIVPLPEATGSGPAAFGADQAGFGVTIIPLRHAQAADVVKTAENFLARPNTLRADVARNFVLAQGSTNDRRAAAAMIASLDVEWMRNQSVGVYPLKTTAPATMIRELDRLFDAGEGGQGAGAIKFQPITRMNAVMAITRNAKMLARVTQWVRRLDRADTSNVMVRVYRLEYGAATKIAKILNELFVGKGAGSTSEAPASQIAPGEHATQSKLDSLSSGSSFGSNAGAAGGAGTQRAATGGGAANERIGAAFENFNEKKEADAEAKSEAAGAGTGARGLRISADTANNSIIVYSNQEDYRMIERSLRELDRPQLQVSIEATVAEVTLTDKLQYGVQYFLGNTARVNASQTNATTASATASAVADGSATDAVSSLVLQRVLPGFNLLLGPQSRPHLILNALSTLTNVKVLSAPSLVVTDNQPALLQVGQEIPIQTGSATVLSSSNTVVNSIQMRDTGVILKVWPHVHANGVVQLEVEQEISNAIDTSLTPTISQRRVHSTISVTSGQTVMLGGMISEQENGTQDGLPILRRIAYLGDLFGNTDKSKIRQEIIVFIKPQIIRDAFDAQTVAEEFRSKLEMMRGPADVIAAPLAAAPRRIRK